jgi:hypothetical protein
VFKCKQNLLPKVSRTKVLRRNIPEDQDEKIEIHTTRPLILIAGMIYDAKKPHMKGQKVRIVRNDTRGGRRARTKQNWAQADRCSMLHGLCLCKCFFTYVWATCGFSRICGNHGD